jgi:DNA-binding NarL/FixJ family response regulator
MPPHRRINEILLLDPDGLCRALLAESLGRTFPGARIHAEREPAKAAEILTDHGVDLFVVAVRGFDLDAITLLGVWAEHQAERVPVLVVTPDVDSTAMLALRDLPITGVLDSSCSDLGEFATACAAVARRLSYRSRSAKPVATATVAAASEAEPLTFSQPPRTPPTRVVSNRRNRWRR